MTRSIGEGRTVLPNEDWRPLADTKDGWVTFTHVLYPLYGRVSQNLLVDFADATGQPIDEVVPYLNPQIVLDGLPNPLGRLFWRSPPTVWPHLFKYLMSVACVDVEHQFYWGALAQRLPVRFGPLRDSEPVDVVAFGVASTVGTYSFGPSEDSTLFAAPYKFVVGPVLPEIARTAAAFFATDCEVYR